jgi:hypothetical protein
MKKSRFWVALIAAVSAVSAVAVSIAGSAAAEGTAFTAAEYPAFVSGEQSEPGSPILTLESGLTVSCEFGGVAGEITGSTSALGVDPGFGACAAFGVGEASFEADGCEFVFHPGSGSGDEFTGSFDIACPAGKKIAVKAGECEVQIGPQTGLGPVGYDEVTAAEPEEVEAGFEMEAASGFAYTKTLDGGSCPLSGTGTKTDGVFDNGLKLRAGNTETLEPIAFGIE